MPSIVKYSQVYILTIVKRYGYHQRENTGSRLFTEVKPCWTGLISGWVTIKIKIPCAVLLGKSGWRCEHLSRLPPLLQMSYVDWVSVDLNLTSRVSSGHSGFLPHQNWLLVLQRATSLSVIYCCVLPSINKVDYYYYYYLSRSVVKTFWGSSYQYNEIRHLNDFTNVPTFCCWKMKDLRYCVLHRFKRWTAN